MLRIVATARSWPPIIAASGRQATPQPCGAKGGLPPLHVACKANLAGNPSHSRHTPWGENPRVCPSVGWLGGAWNPCPEGAIPFCQLCPSAQLPVT